MVIAFTLLSQNIHHLTDNSTSMPNIAKVHGRKPAVHTEISVEYPLNCPEAYAATVMVSPTRDLGEDGYEDYDWSDLELSLSDIEALIGMAKS